MVSDIKNRIVGGMIRGKEVDLSDQDEVIVAAFLLGSIELINKLGEEAKNRGAMEISQGKD